MEGTIKKMKKSDQILLAKIIQARKVKDQTNATKRGETYVDGPLSPLNTVRAMKAGYIQPRNSTAVGKRGMTGKTMSSTALNNLEDTGGRTRPTSSQTLTRSVSMEATAPRKLPKPGDVDYNPNPPIDEGKLSKQILTPAAQRRMLNTKTAQKFAKMGMPHDILKKSDSIFLPKKTIVRPDGATLMDVYESKKQDLWGQIIAAQYKEDEDNKYKVHEVKMKRNHDFGVTFRKDLEDIRWRRENAENDDEAILKIVEAKSKAADDVQQQRKKDAILRQKEFIMGCLEDIETKKIQRAKELDFEMEASSIMIEKNKALIREDEEKAAREKARMKKQMEDLYREGQELIAKRQKDKEQEWEYVAKIQKEAAIKAEKEEARRANDLSAMLRNAEDGPAHNITDRLMKANLAYKNEQLRILRHAGNGLNAQLLLSEEQNASRSNADYSAVMADNDAIAKKNERIRQEEHEFNLKMGKLALQRSLEFQAQERKNREAKVAAGLKYQEELNVQLAMTKDRKLREIQETMVMEERKMNMALFRQYPSIKIDTTPGPPSDKLKDLREREAAEPRGPEVKIGKFKMR